MSAAWTRKEGQNPKGGLNTKGRASLKAQGQDIKPPVKSGDNPRRASFLARMAGNDGPEMESQLDCFSVSKHGEQAVKQMLEQRLKLYQLGIKNEMPYCNI